MQDRRNYLIEYNETARERMKDLQTKKSEIVRDRCKKLILLTSQSDRSNNQEKETRGQKRSVRM